VLLKALMTFCAVISLPVADGTRFISSVNSFDLNSATATFQAGIDGHRPLLKTQKLNKQFPKNNAAATNSNSGLMVFAVMAAIGLTVIFSQGSDMTAHLLLALATVGTTIRKSTKGKDQLSQALQDWDAPRPNKDDDTALSLYKRSTQITKSGHQKSRTGASRGTPHAHSNVRCYRDMPHTPQTPPAKTGNNCAVDEDADYQAFLAKLDAELDFATIPNHKGRTSKGRKPTRESLSGLTKVGGGFRPDQSGFYDDWEEDIFDWEAVPRAPPAPHKKPMDGELVGTPPERELCLPKPQVAPSMYIKGGHPRPRSFFGEERFFQEWAPAAKQLPLQVNRQLPPPQ